MAPSKPLKAKKFGKSVKLTSGSQLKEAVHALGGDEQDVELLRGIESDEDAPANNKTESKGQVSVICISQ
jgi:hypothetical protein